MKKLCNLFLLLLASLGITAQDLVGKITDQDTAHSPLFMAEVAQMQEGKTIATYKTYFDGTFRIKVKPGQSYGLKVSFPGRTDTTVNIMVDKHGTLYAGTLFISLHKDGLRLTGFVLDAIQDIPIKDACIILRNVMTREEQRYTTDVNGSYNLKMDYETNYSLKIDKYSEGIINKYQDTSFNISTIGFNKPLDFRLDIKLGPTNGYVAPRPQYDPRAKPVNRNIKPSLVVLGVKDSVQKHRQDSLIAALNLQVNKKDSSIAMLDKRIGDISKPKAETKVALHDNEEEEQKKKAEAAATAAREAEEKKKQLADEEKRRELEKAEADLKAKEQAEKELQEKLNKQIMEAEAIRRKQEALMLERQRAAKARAEEDSLLRNAEAKNREIMARRKHIKDSLTQLENQKAQALAAVAPPVKTPKADSVKNSFTERPTAVLDSSIKSADATNRELMLKRKHVLDSLINIESRRTQVKTNNRGPDQSERIKDSLKIAQAREAERLKILMAERVQYEQDSILKAAMARNREMLVRRKQIADSITLAEKNRLQALNDAKKLEGEKQEYDLEEKRKQQQLQEEIIRRQKAETERKAKEEQELLAAKKAEDEATRRQTQIEKDLAAMKKAREEAEAKVIAERREREAAEKFAQKESKRIAKELAEQTHKKKLAQEEEKRKLEEQQRITARKAEADREQRELEAKRLLEEQEKNQLTQRLGKLQKDEEAVVTKDQETKRQEYNPEQALQNEKLKAVKDYEVGVLRENKRKADSLVSVYHPLASGNGAKVIKARGYVKNGQTEEPIASVSINIRRLNSVVSQEVTSDTGGRYDIIVDSGYFYLVAYYKDKYEISKQILDLTSYPKAEYTMVIQYMKELDDFDPNAKMPVVEFEKNSSKLPADVWADMQTIVKMMKDVPELKVKIYGLGSVDEDYPMELSVTRARLVADLLLESGIKPSRIRINGIGAYRPRSGCTEGKTCSENQYKLDRVVMYKVVKD